MPGAYAAGTRAAVGLAADPSGTNSTTPAHQADGLRCGAGERDRTADLPFTRRPLCQLSYTGGVVLMLAEGSTAAPAGGIGGGRCR